MRTRSVLLVLGTALLVVFALLNWPEFRRPVPLNLGWGTTSGPLSLVLLGLLAVAVLWSLASGAAQRSRHLRREREQERALQTQRELAERAEASRFMDLRQMLDGHLRESRQREATAASSLDQALARQQRETRNQLELLHRSLSTRLGEMEARLDARLDQAAPTAPTRAATMEPTLPAGAPHAPHAAHEAPREAVPLAGQGESREAGLPPRVVQPAGRNT